MKRGRVIALTLALVPPRFLARDDLYHHFKQVLRYPSGGNYWSDYTGVEADGDRIGDTPYIIDENNVAKLASFF